MRNRLVSLLLILIITIPAYLSLLNNGYFSMHDDQHISRLFLLDQGLKQGYVYPRWVDILGFNFGYPLFNFYPPLTYYIGELFHLIGFSLIWSIKLVFITGFILAAYGMYLFVKKLTNNTSSGYLAAALYTYFFYHAALIYVRGALAEFFAMAILPFVFLSITSLSKEKSFKNTAFFGVSFALLILTHPLIAVPALIFIGTFFLFYFLTDRNERWIFLRQMLLGGIIGLALSAFFWLPSAVERQYTLVDTILLSELANYKVHFVYPLQLWSSLWGYGGSGKELADGMTFQLGKSHIGLFLFSLTTSIIYLVLRRKDKESLGTIIIFYFLGLLSLFSVFMTTAYSTPIWDNLKYLWYLQFPWRFLTFAGFFISAAAAYSIYFIDVILGRSETTTQESKKLDPGQARMTTMLLTIAIILTLFFVYSKYFHPQKIIYTTDEKLTSFGEIAWRISRTSFEFIPKGVKTTKSELNTTIPAITKEQVSAATYEVTSGNADVVQTKNKFTEKSFIVTSSYPLKFRLNTYHFPGWKAYIDDEPLTISDLDDYKRMTVNIPRGTRNLEFKFENTPVRTAGNWISIVALALTIFGLVLSKRYKEQLGY